MRIVVVALLPQSAYGTSVTAAGRVGGRARAEAIGCARAMLRAARAAEDAGFSRRVLYAAASVTITMKPRSTAMPDASRPPLNSRWRVAPRCGP
jgi:hypothetical protein